MPAGAGACQASGQARQPGRGPKARLGQGDGCLITACAIDTLAAPLYCNVVLQEAQIFYAFSFCYLEPQFAAQIFLLFARHACYPAQTLDAVFILGRYRRRSPREWRGYSKPEPGRSHCKNR